MIAEKVAEALDLDLDKLDTVEVRCQHVAYISRS